MNEIPGGEGGQAFFRQTGPIGDVHLKRLGWLLGWHAEGGVESAHLPTYTLSYFSVSHSFPILHSLLLLHV